MQHRMHCYKRMLVRLANPNIETTVQHVSRKRGTLAVLTI